MLERALEVDGTSVEAAVRLGINLTGAVLNRWSTAQAADEARADELLGRARLAGPTDSLALYGTGMLLRWQGRLDEAITVMRLANEVDPTDPDMRRELGTALMHRGALAEALHWLEQSIDMDPCGRRVEVSYWALGACQQLIGQSNKACDWLLRARARNPELAFVRLRLAAVLGQIGEIEDARRELSAAQSGGHYRSLAAFGAERQARHPDYRAKCEPTFYAGLRRAGIAER